jgi:hypothetical protein
VSHIASLVAVEERTSFLPPPGIESRFFGHPASVAVLSGLSSSLQKKKKNEGKANEMNEQKRGIE